LPQNGIEQEAKSYVQSLSGCWVELILMPLISFHCCCQDFTFFIRQIKS